MDHIKAWGDWVAGAVSFAALVQWVNVLLAVPAAIYACLRIYEWFEKRRK
jgi:hypothetical protein